MSDRNPARRDFLRTGGCLALALVSAGVIPRVLLARPLGSVVGSPRGAERTYPIPATDSVSIDRDAQVILVRSQNRAFAFALSCPHQNASVKWIDKDHRFQCTRHDSKYQPDGVYTSGRATRNMDRFAIRRDAASLVVNLDRFFKSDTDAAAWAAAFAPLT